MTKVLVVWHDVPERERAYLLTFESEMAYRRCLTCHGHFLGCVNDDEVDECLNELSELLEHVQADQVIFDSEGKVNLVKVIDQNVAFVLCGQMM